jgi:ribonuclease J
MARITVYGGAGEIGGNQVLVESGRARILLDFGARMGFEGEFFAEFLDTRKSTALKDRITIGALPMIPGIYWGNLVKPDGTDKLSNERYRRVLKADSPYLRMADLETYGAHLARTEKPFLDAIFVSHAHMDHVGAIEYLDPSIPLYCSECTKVFLETIDEVTSFKVNALESKLRSVDFNKDGATFPGSPKLVSKPVARVCKTIKDGKSVRIEKDMAVKLIEVDHSIPGASSFVAKADGHKILYTGDFRFHGTRPMTQDGYVKKVGKNVDIMICEGTRIADATPRTESEIGKKIAKQIKGAKGLVFVDFSWKDTTRFETIRDAAKKAGRTFVINGRLAMVLHRLGLDPEGDVKVFLKRRDSALYSPGDYARYLHEYGLTTNAEKEEKKIDSTHYDAGVVAKDLKASPERYVMMMSYYDMGQIFDLADEKGKIPNSIFIKAQCEPFSDEMEIDEERLIAWLEKFGIEYVPGDSPLPEGCTNAKCEKIRPRLDRSHVSGHASRPELREIIRKVAPKVLIPIHTKEPEEFEAILKEIADEGGPKITLKIPEYGEPIEL